nr:ATP-binding protein [Aromatoleum toluvorans]
MSCRGVSPRKCNKLSVASRSCQSIDRTPVLRSILLGKYRVLVFAVAAFFLVNVGVFTLNFILLQYVDRDAASINAGGKLRGYSQQLAKALLTLSHESVAGEPVQTSQAQISEAYQAFDQALAQVQVFAAATEDRSVIEQADKLDRQWQPLRDAAITLLAGAVPDPGAIESAVTLSNTRNVRLMQLADDLTAEQERLAADRARWMRTLQSGAIGAALLMFVFIVMHVARRLGRSDRAAEQSRRETTDILRTVREGLFLIDRNGVVGTQRSDHLAKVIPQPLAAGDNFLVTLAALVSPDTMDSARQYIELLLNERVKPALLADLNPLQRVRLNQHGNARPKYLNFSFQPVRGNAGEGITGLLVAVADVSQEVRLEHELASAEERARSEVALLLQVLDNNPDDVDRFLADARAKLDRLNTTLRDVKPDSREYAAVVTKVFRDVHSIKGEAAALSIGTVTAQAHRFEETLTGLRNRRTLAGDDLIPVATGIGHLLQELSKVDTVISRIAAFARQPAGAGVMHTGTPAPEEGVLQSMQRIQRLALAVASDLNKKVRVETSLPHVGVIPEAVHRLLREGLPQLVRNAVVHGIEESDERRRAGKHEEGRLRIELVRAADGSLELTVADDGRGIDVHALRSRLVESGHRTPDQVAAMSDRDVVAMLFEPGVSTATTVDAHAGRGVGLDVVGTLARETGARLRLASAPSAYTRFTLQWSPA